MKIVHINSYYHPNFHGGADISVQVLCEGLLRNGHEVVVISLAKGGSTIIGDVNGVKVYYLAVNNRLSHIHSSSQSQFRKATWQLLTALNSSISETLLQIFKREKPDIVHTHILAGFSSRPWVLAESLGLPLVHTLHDYFPICPRGTMYRGNSACSRQCPDCSMVSVRRKQHSQFVDAVIGVSNFILNRHLDKGYFKSAHIKTRIFNSVYGHNLVWDPPHQLASNSKVRVGFLGRLEPFKGISDLLEAFSIIDCEKAVLKVAGTGSKDFVSKLKSNWSRQNIEFLGVVEPQAFFQQVDVLVVPSRYHDPAPRVLMEACEFGIPVIGSSMGGGSELVDIDKTGWIFEAGNIEALQNVLAEVIHNPSRTANMRSACLEKSKTLGVEQLIDHHDKTYQSLLPV
jgi:glycosyltransferase involved in cell wall biosynthesis